MASLAFNGYVHRRQPLTQRNAATFALCLPLECLIRSGSLSFPPLTNFYRLLHFYLSAYSASNWGIFNTFPCSSPGPLSLVCPHLSLQDNRCGCPELIIHEGTATYSWGNKAYVNFKLSDLVPTSFFSTHFCCLYWKITPVIFISCWRVFPPDEGTADGKRPSTNSGIFTFHGNAY